MAASRRSLERPEAGRARGWWRTAVVGFWLGWRIESNWTDPVLFASYSVVRPLAGSLILVFMYFAVARGGRGPILAFFVVGTAFWPLVLNGVKGITRGVLEDREKWRTIREIYTSPASYRVYLIGRALARALAVGVPALVVTLLAGALALDVPIGPGARDLPLLIGGLLLGLVAILAIGMFAAGAAVSVSSHAWQMPDGVATALYLVCGTLFPVGVLPGALQAVSDALPLTWWLEAMRRALLPPGATLSYAWASDARVLATLAALTAAWTAGAALVYAWAERRARRLGHFDVATGY